MKKILFATTLLFGIVVFQAYAQCNRTHYLCTDQFSKEERGEFWNINNQSKSATFDKGKVYEMSFIAYAGFEYRISTCTDVISASGVKFELAQDIVVRVKDGDGNTNIKKTT